MTRVDDIAALWAALDETEQNAVYELLSHRVRCGAAPHRQPLAEVEGTVRHTYATGHEAHRCSCCPGLHVAARHIDGIPGAARCDWLYDQYRTLPDGTRVVVQVFAAAPQEQTDE